MEDIKKFKEAVAAFDTEMEKIKNATNPSQISDSERVLNLILRNIVLLAPRLNNGVLQASRKRRSEIARGE